LQTCIYTQLSVNFSAVAAKTCAASEAAERSEVPLAGMKVSNAQKDVHVELERLIAKTRHRNRDRADQSNIYHLAL
jgi:hypothetical protein